MVLCGTPAGRTGTRKLRRAAGREGRRRGIHQLDFLYWGDVHFVISATHQMSEALDGLPGGPKLPNSCARCRQMQGNAARARGRRKAQERLPPEVRQRLLDAIYAGKPFRRALRDLGLTSRATT
jgi:hypothetical protein